MMAETRGAAHLAAAMSPQSKPIWFHERRGRSDGQEKCEAVFRGPRNQQGATARKSAKRFSAGRATKNNMIDVENLVYEYPTARALKGVSLHVAGQTIAALVGPNGAGKTTLLRCLAAL